MARIKEPVKPLYLVVSEVREHGYFHLHARISTDRHENGQRYPYGTDDDYSDGLLYSGLRASCQGDERSRLDTNRFNAVYGYDRLDYHDCHSVELRKAKRMVKTLERVERGLAKFSETRGYCRSYGEYLGRLAEVLGCIGMAFMQTPKRRNMSGQDYRWMTVGDGVNEANNLIYQWQREALDQQEAAS